MSSSMGLVSTPAHLDHGAGQKCTLLMITNVDDPAGGGYQVDGLELGISLLGVAIITVRQNVQNDPACSNLTWHNQSDCIR